MSAKPTFFVLRALVAPAPHHSLNVGRDKRGLGSLSRGSPLRTGEQWGFARGVPRCEHCEQWGFTRGVPRCEHCEQWGFTRGVGTSPNNSSAVGVPRCEPESNGGSRIRHRFLFFILYSILFIILPGGETPPLRAGRRGAAILNS